MTASRSQLFATAPIGIARALDARPQPSEHELVGYVSWSLDAQRDGLLSTRPRSLRFAYVTGALAASEYRAAIALIPAPETTVRVFRVSAYVRDATIGSQPREATLRSLTVAEIRCNGLLLRDVDAPPDVQEAISSTIAWARTTPLPVVDSDVVASGTGAVRVARDWPAGLVLDRRFSSPGAGFASIEFYWRRTPAPNDVDLAVLTVAYTAAPSGTYPPA